LPFASSRKINDNFYSGLKYSANSQDEGTGRNFMIYKKVEMEPDKKIALVAHEWKVVDEMNWTCEAF
jgi:hypothetical protein